MTSNETNSEMTKGKGEKDAETTDSAPKTDNEKTNDDGGKDPIDRLLIESDETKIPEEFNIYRNKKTLTQGLMDIALFSANANQLRSLFERGDRSAFFYIITSLIIISLILQVGVAILLLLSTRYTVCEKRQREIAYRYGNYVTVGIFLITVVNVFVAAFGGSAMAGVTTVST